MSTSLLTLRPYQVEAVETVFGKAATVRRQLIQMATGLGKTATALNIVREYIAQSQQPFSTLPKRVLWLTHRDELVQQVLRAIEMWLPEHAGEVGIVKAERDDTGHPIVVASVQTLAVTKRRDNLLADQLIYGPFGLVVSDEHHLSPAPTWAGTLEALGCGEPGGPLMIGLTATPNRSDGVGLKATTDEIVFARDIVWAIGNGYLVPPKGITVRVDLSEVKIARGDYTDGSLSDVLELGGAHIAIARLIDEHAKDRKTICFTPTVAFAGLVAEECTKLGIAAEMVSGNTPLAERREMYDRLRSGETRVIANCAVLQEGFDEPSVDCIVNARPTRSATTFAQRVGRGLRLYPGKTDCLVIALAGSERNKLATLGSLAGKSWEDAMKAAEAKVEDGELFDFAGEFDEVVRNEAEKAKLKSRPVDLLTAVRAKITWAVIDQHCFARTIPRDADPRDSAMIVKEDWRGLGWRVVGTYKNGKGERQYQRLLEGVDFTTAQAFADDEIRRRVPAPLLNPKARWRSEPASVEQKKALRAWKVPIPEGPLSRGEAGDLLDVAIVKRLAARA